MPEFTPDQIDKRIKGDPEMQRLAKDDEAQFLVEHERIYNEFGYKPDGKPLSMAKKAIKGFSKATGIPEGMAQFGAASVLPTVGTVAGMAVGSAGGPLGAAVGASGGSVLGEAANSLLGITDPMDKTDMAIAAGAPLLGPLASKTAPSIIAAGKRLVPGATSALHELAGEAMTKQLQGMRVTGEHVDLARKAMGAVPDFMMDAPNTKLIFNEESAKAARQALSEIPGADKYLDVLNGIVKANELGGQGKVSFKKLMTLEEGFNQIKGERPGELWAAASGKIIDDLEAATTGLKPGSAAAVKAQQGLQAFKSFIAINRKHQADETMVNMFTVGKGILKPSAYDSTLVEFDQKAFKLKLQNDPKLKKAFTPEERKSIEDSVADVGYIGKMPKAMSGASGLGSRFGKGGMIGLMAGGPWGAVVGGGIEEVLRQAVSTDVGRKVVKSLAKEGRGRINMLELQSIMGQVTAGAVSGSVAGIKSMPTGTAPFAQEQ